MPSSKLLWVHDHWVVIVEGSDHTGAPSSVVMTLDEWQDLEAVKFAVSEAAKPTSPRHTPRGLAPPPAPQSPEGASRPG